MFTNWISSNKRLCNRLLNGGSAVAPKATRLLKKTEWPLNTLMLTGAIATIESNLVFPMKLKSVLKKFISQFMLADDPISEYATSKQLARDSEVTSIIRLCPNKLGDIGETYSYMH